jgi:hypothetical protein
MLIGIGKARRLWVPMPLILLWPLWLLGCFVWLIMRAIGLPHEKTFKLALVMATQLSGLRIDVDSDNDDSKFHLRMV